eukprot:c6368_g1_i1.p1 GENE.c6368_g1_i1~~c6368_g1_i1.p1  ORF type:complete len:336 (-),score=37.56 c6368_g1_i1:38-1045(-)
MQFTEPNLYPIGHPNARIPILRDVIIHAYSSFLWQALTLFTDNFRLPPFEIFIHIHSLLSKISFDDIAAGLKQADEAMAVFIGFMADKAVEDCKLEVSEVYKTCMRSHLFGQQMFYNLLSDLIQGLDVGPVNVIVSPGCGQLFEAGVLEHVFRPSLIIGQDILENSLHAAMHHNRHLKTLALQHVDVSQPSIALGYACDMAIFIHPNVLNTQVWCAEIDQLPVVDEFEIPFPYMTKHLGVHCMCPTWTAIISNTLARLRKNALMIFICYEKRERNLIELYLQTLPGVKLERKCDAPGNTTFLYVESPKASMRVDMQTYDWVVMKNYHCGIVARKL